MNGDPQTEASFAVVPPQLKSCFWFVFKSAQSSAAFQLTLYTAGVKSALSCASTHRPLPKDHNYCFSGSSSWYHQPTPSLNERVMAVGKMELHRAHCPSAPLILSVLQRIIHRKLKGLDVTGLGLAPPLHADPEAGSEVRDHKPQSTCALVLHQSTNLEWWLFIVFHFWRLNATLSNFFYPHFESKWLSDIIWNQVQKQVRSKITIKWTKNINSCSFSSKARSNSLSAITPWCTLSLADFNCTGNGEITH